jgi:hypothetical protein
MLLRMTGPAEENLWRSLMLVWKSVGLVWRTVFLVWKSTAPSVEISRSGVGKHVDSVEEWHTGGGIPVEEPVEKRCGAVDALWTPCANPVVQRARCPGE